MPRDLSAAQRSLMDLLADHPDWTNEHLAQELGCSVSWVEKLLGQVCERYGVQTRTGAVLVHLGLRRKRHRAPQGEGLGL